MDQIQRPQSVDELAAMLSQPYESREQQPTFLGRLLAKLPWVRRSV
jgi:hypothetical protein